MRVAAQPGKQDATGRVKPQKFFIRLRPSAILWLAKEKRQRTVDSMDYSRPHSCGASFQRAPRAAALIEN